MAVWYQEGCIGQWHGPKMVFSKEFQAFRGTLGMGARLCLRADPESNAFAERFVRTARAECLDWVLVRGERHLDWVLREFVGHYNHERPHRGIDLEVAVPHPTAQRFQSGDGVERVDRLGGLLHEYRLVA